MIENWFLTLRERERTQNSECFIVEGRLTHYKWYDYKHAHTTYTKQLTNNTKQTDKTKRNNKQNKTKRERDTQRETETERDRERQSQRQSQRDFIAERRKPVEASPGSIETFNPKFLQWGLCQGLPGRLDSYGTLIDVYICCIFVFWCTLCLRPNITYTVNCMGTSEENMHAQDSPRQVLRLGLPAGRTACCESTLNFESIFLSSLRRRLRTGGWVFSGGPGRYHSPSRGMRS